MAVYVDDMNAPYTSPTGGFTMKMSHMIADSTEELLAMVDTIGIRRSYIQHPHTYKEHFDISLSKKALAIQHGAIAITWSELGEMVAHRKPSNTVEHSHG